jgi:hypothetical protein
MFYYIPAWIKWWNEAKEKEDKEEEEKTLPFGIS